MTQEMLEQAYTAAAAMVRQVGAPDLDRPTPCASWTVRGLLDHVIGNTARFPAAVRSGDLAGAGGPPPWEEDPAAAFDAGGAAVLAAFADPASADRSVTMPFGEIPVPEFRWIAATDTFVHAWDLAVALGRPTDLDPELAEQLLARSSRRITGAFRGADGVAPFGPEVSAPPGATAADRLAAFLGRRC